MLCSRRGRLSRREVRPRRRPRHVRRQGRAHRRRRARRGLGVRAGRAARAAGRRRGAAAGRLVAGAWSPRRGGCSPRHDGPAAEVAAVCCSTQSEGTVPVDEAGAPLTNCILWMDMRGAPHLRRQFGGPLSMQGISLPRIRRWVKLTGGMPSPTGKDPAAHMLYVRDELPEVYERTYKFLNVPDYLNLRLTGRMAASYDSIMTSWVTDNRDADAVKYDAGLVRDCGIDGDKLPEIVKCTEVLGRLTPAAAEELGLAPETQVVAGAIDTTAAAVGAGTTDDFALHLYLGTSSWLAAHVPFKKTDVFASLASVPCAAARPLAAHGAAGHRRRQPHLAARQRALPRGRAAGRGGAAGRVQDLRPDRGARAARQQRRALHAVDLGRARPGRRRRAARRPLQPLARDHARGHRARLLRGRRAQHALAAAGRCASSSAGPSSAINLVGGGGQSDVWCQIVADVLGVTVRRVRDPIQANARGAAWIAAAGLGEIAFGDVPRLVRVRRRVRAVGRGPRGVRCALPDLSRDPQTDAPAVPAHQPRGTRGSRDADRLAGATGDGRAPSGGRRAATACTATAGSSSASFMLVNVMIQVLWIGYAPDHRRRRGLLRRLAPAGQRCSRWCS